MQIPQQQSCRDIYKLCSDCFVTINVGAERNSHRIRIAMKKTLVKWAPGAETGTFRKIYVNTMLLVPWRYHIISNHDMQDKHIQFVLPSPSWAMLRNYTKFKYISIFSKADSARQGVMWCRYCQHVLAFSGLVIEQSSDLQYLRFNTLRQRQNGRHFPDDTFKWIFANENAWTSIISSLKFVPVGAINKISALVQIMAWRLPGDKPLSEQWWLVYWCISLGLSELIKSNILI